MTIQAIKNEPEGTTNQSAATLYGRCRTTTLASAKKPAVRRKRTRLVLWLIFTQFILWAPTNVTSVLLGSVTTDNKKKYFLRPCVFLNPIDFIKEHFTVAAPGVLIEQDIKIQPAKAVQLLPFGKAVLPDGYQTLAAKAKRDILWSHIQNITYDMDHQPTEPYNMANATKIIVTNLPCAGLHAHLR
ncbi:hypothetical protein RvY_14754 [Ramazzottius varieornatus]|uniref:Uncharacterized protein n=1 Tax=Ramazzottius varieornatus TaxID=947166 RepID=A0A1D1VZM1_RAMVA|nr:hypothetical protein RvY_14754 [Ramazzottius varieornatus]